ncbi:MAG: hypothetical protein O7C75_10190 [Verrucomicrobia bacterium]|nr:hypothetical protein [Verrucomicrobiota bacterium]
MRKLLIFLGVIVLLLMIAAGVALFSPPVHKAAFLWALDGKVDAVSVMNVRLTSTSFVVEDIKLAHQGANLSIDRFEVKASWIDLARSDQVHIDEVLVDGLEADLVTVASASGGGLGAWLDLLGGDDQVGSDEPWEGVLAMMKPSNVVSIGRIRLDGQVLLPEQQTIDLNLSLDDLALGKQTRIKLQGVFLDEGGSSPVDRANYDLSLELDQTASGEMNGILGTLALKMVGDDLNPKGQLEIDGHWNLSRTASGEVLTVVLSESGKSRPLIDTELDMNVQSGQLEGRLSANLNGAIVPVSLLGLPAMISTATFSMDGQVEWNFKQGVGQFNLRGAGVLEQRPWQYQFSGTGTADQLPAIKGFVKTGFADDAGAGDLTVNLDVNSKGDGQINLPIEVRRGDRLSKLSVQTDLASLKLDPFKIALNGDTVYLEDLQSVGKALAAWGYSMQQLDTVAQETPDVIDSAADSGVPWEGLSGNATIVVNRLVFPQGYVLEEMNAATVIRPDSVSLTSFSTRIDQGSILGKGDLVYTATSQTPYTLRAEGRVANIPSDLLDLGSGAPITGTWNGSVSVLGQAGRLDQLADTIQLSLDVEGSAGLLQLTRVNEGANKTAQIVSIGAALFGQFLKDDRLTAVSQMTEYLQRVPYDSIRIKIDRFANGQVAIRDFTILGPELMLSGNGSVDAQNWQTLAQGALDMNLTMGSKGTFGNSAMALGLTGQELSGEYQLWRKPINISGSLSNPNFSALKDMIFEALR